MKKLNMMLWAVAGILALHSCQNNNSSENSETSDSTLDSMNNSTALMNESDKDEDSNQFMKKAAAGGIMEVKAGNLALQNASDENIKAVAKMIVADHEVANKELQAIATKNNVLLPTELPADKQEHLDKMKNLKGKDFDGYYLQMMREDHMNDIALFKESASSSRSKEVRNFAAKTLPVLEKHAKELEKISL